MKLYSFDVDGAALDELPLAARRGLDQAGWKLSLAGFRSLEHAQRRALVELGSASPVDVQAVTRVVALASPAAARVDPIFDPPSDVPPEHIAAAFAQQGPISSAVWSSLGDVDRYALGKVAAREDAERKRAAYVEIIGHTRVSTHVRAGGGVQMVNVARKAVTLRRAEAESRVSMNETAFRLLESHAVPKGDVLATARIAGITAAKRTSELIPLCHPLALSHVVVDVTLDPKAHAVLIAASVEIEGKTGVEMEALVAASVAALTVYDMLKAADRGMQIGPTRLVTKSGGASGEYARVGAGDAPPQSTRRRDA